MNAGRKPDYDYDYNYDYESPTTIANKLCKAAEEKYYLSLSGLVSELADGALAIGVLATDSQGRYPLHVAAAISTKSGFADMVHDLYYNDQYKIKKSKQILIKAMEQKDGFFGGGDQVLHIAARHQCAATLGSLFVDLRVLQTPRYFIDAIFVKGSSFTESKGQTVLDLLIQHNPTALPNLIENICDTVYEGHCATEFIAKLFVHYPDCKIPQKLLEILFLSRALNGWQDRQSLATLCERADINSVAAALKVRDSKSDRSYSLDCERILARRIAERDAKIAQEAKEQADRIVAEKARELAEQEAKRDAVDNLERTAVVPIGKITRFYQKQAFQKRSTFGKLIATYVWAFTHDSKATETTFSVPTAITQVPTETKSQSAGDEAAARRTLVQILEILKQPKIGDEKSTINAETISNVRLVFFLKMEQMKLVESKAEEKIIRDVKLAAHLAVIRQVKIEFYTTDIVGLNREFQNLLAVEIPKQQKLHDECIELEKRRQADEQERYLRQLRLQEQQRQQALQHLELLEKDDQANYLRVINAAITSLDKDLPKTRRGEVLSSQRSCDYKTTVEAVSANLNKLMKSASEAKKINHEMVSQLKKEVEKVAAAVANEKVIGKELTDKSSRFSIMVAQVKDFPVARPAVSVDQTADLRVDFRFR